MGSHMSWLNCGSSQRDEWPPNIRHLHRERHEEGVLVSRKAPAISRHHQNRHKEPEHLSLVGKSSDFSRHLVLPNTSTLRATHQARSHPIYQVRPNKSVSRSDPQPSGSSNYHSTSRSRKRLPVSRNNSHQSSSSNYQSTSTSHKQARQTSNNSNNTVYPIDRNGSAVALDSRSQRLSQALLRVKTPLPNIKTSAERVDDLTKHFYDKVLPPCLEFCRILDKDPDGHARPWTYHEVKDKLEIEILFQLAAIDNDGTKEVLKQVRLLKEQVWAQQDAVEIENIKRLCDSARKRAQEEFLEQVERQVVARYWENLGGT